MLSLVNIIGPHRPITDRLREANERLAEVLFLTPKDKWKEQTGRERPKNLAELKAAMAEAGYTPDIVHADGLTPAFAEDFLLGFQRKHNLSVPMPIAWSKLLKMKELQEDLVISRNT